MAAADRRRRVPAFVQRGRLVAGTITVPAGTLPEAVVLLLPDGRDGYPPDPTPTNRR